jgi:hypothetical protein
MPPPVAFSRDLNAHVRAFALWATLIEADVRVSTWTRFDARTVRESGDTPGLQVVSVDRRSTSESAAIVEMQNSVRGAVRSVACGAASSSSKPSMRCRLRYASSPSPAEANVQMSAGSRFRGSSQLRSKERQVLIYAPAAM